VGLRVNRQRNGDGGLVIESDGYGGGFAVVPGFLGDREVEEEHAFGRLAGGDQSLSEKRLRGEGLECRKRGIEVGEILFFGGAGGDLLTFGGGKGGCEVLEEEWEVEAVFDANDGEDVEFVLGLVSANDDGVGFVDSMGRIDGGAKDGDFRRGVRGVAEDEREGQAEDEKRQQDWCEEVAAGGLGEGDIWHF
jgi:hypothetical protein